MLLRSVLIRCHRFVDDLILCGIEREQRLVLYILWNHAMLSVFIVDGFLSMSATLSDILRDAPAHTWLGITRVSFVNFFYHSCARFFKLNSISDRLCIEFDAQRIYYY